MSQLEQNGIPSEYSRTLVGRAGAKERLRRSQKITCVAWQSMRLLLLAWSLLCFYCALQSSLSARTDFAAVGINLFFGITSWWLACRSTAAPEWRERR